MKPFLREEEEEEEEEGEEEEEEGEGDSLPRHKRRRTNSEPMRVSLTRCRLHQLQELGRVELLILALLTRSVSQSCKFVYVCMYTYVSGGNSAYSTSGRGLSSHC